MGSPLAMTKYSSIETAANKRVSSASSSAKKLQDLAFTVKCVRRPFYSVTNSEIGCQKVQVGDKAAQESEKNRQQSGCALPRYMHIRVVLK